MEGRTMDDGWTPDHGHPISSPCEPNSSGELKKPENLTCCKNIGASECIVSVSIFCDIIKTGSCCIYIFLEL